MGSSAIIKANRLIAICEEMKVLLSHGSAFSAYYDKLLGELQRLSMKLDGGEDAAVTAYRKRRQERLGGREDEEAHGNTRIPFGLCEREGIPIDPGWSPRDAWAALEGKGISPSKVYQSLRERGTVEGESGRESGMPVRKLRGPVSDKLRRALKSQKNEAVFFSGCSRRDEHGDVNMSSVEVAEEYARNNAGVTMSILLESSSDMPEWDIDDEEAVGHWEEASRAYAEQASGDVRVIARPPLRDGNIFETIELPALKNNPEVTSIIMINPDTDEKNVIFRR